MLTIKSITSCNINGKPLYSSNLSKRIIEYKTYVDSNYDSKYKLNDNELTIVGVQGLYGYRCGMIGYLSNLLNYQLSQRFNPTLFQNFINRFATNKVLSNDIEIITFWISFLSGKIPLLNIGTWDLKKNLFKNHPILKYSISNISLPSIFNLNSIYLLKPIFDCGCSIYSNKKPIESGFERWNNWDRGYFKHRIFNNGMVWSTYESENKRNAITIINLKMTEDAPSWISDLQIVEMVRLKQKLERKFYDPYYERYETFIMGDFQIEFNKGNLELLKLNHIRIYNKDLENLFKADLFVKEYDNKNLVLHSEYIKKENDMLYVKNTSNYILTDGDNIFNIEFSGIDEKIVVVENPLNFVIIDDCLCEQKVEETSPKKDSKEVEKPEIEEIIKLVTFELNDEHFRKVNNSTSNSNHSHSDSDWEIPTNEI